MEAFLDEVSQAHLRLEGIDSEVNLGAELGSPFGNVGMQVKSRDSITEIGLDKYGPHMGMTRLDNRGRWRGKTWKP